MPSRDHTRGVDGRLIARTAALTVAESRSAAIAVSPLCGFGQDFVVSVAFGDVIEMAKQPKLRSDTFRISTTDAATLDSLSAARGQTD